PLCRLHRPPHRPADREETAARRRRREGDRGGACDRHAARNQRPARSARPAGRPRAGGEGGRAEAPRLLRRARGSFPGVPRACGGPGAARLADEGGRRQRAHLEAAREAAEEALIGVDCALMSCGSRSSRKERQVIVTTMNDIPGYDVDEVYGEVMGLTVRSRNIGSQIGAGLKSILGGELTGMTEARIDSRKQVMERMIEEAEAKGANAIIAMRFDTSEMGGQWTEICAYGTAVRAHKT